MSREGGDWMCSSCNYRNFKKRDLCQQCGYPKFGNGSEVSSYGTNRTEVLPGDWYCHDSNCNEHNYASRPSCRRCGAAKDGYVGGYGGGMMGSEGFANDSSGRPGWKTGDWICNRYGCGEHNYASRMICFKCKTPRADFGGV